MDNLDKLMQEDFVKLKREGLATFRQKHPHFVGILHHYFAGKKNHIGLRITEDGKTAGEYTVFIEGLEITTVEGGRLASEFRTPFGVIRPFAIMERAALEKMLAETDELIANPFTAMRKYLPDITLKFM